MKKLRFLSLIVPAMLLLFSACEKEGDPEPSLTVAIKDPTSITETSFTANWSVTGSGVNTIKVEVSQVSDFTSLLKTISVDDPANTVQLIDGLNGASSYYHRIIANTGDGKSATSNSKKVTTSYTSEVVSLTTPDGVKIGGRICHLSTITLPNPGIICMGVSGLPNLWKNEPVFLELISMGYICFAFDWRGQGQSGFWPPATTVDSFLVYVTDYYRTDLETCYDYFRNLDKVDGSKIVLMGGSLGGVETLIGNNWPGVKASVALSPSRFGLSQGEPLRNVFLIVGAQDESSAMGWNYADECTIIYENALEPKKLLILPGGEHGLEVMAVGGVNEQILDWVIERLGD